ncbi:amino acid transporter [Thermoplasma sp. Kam2015]|uniref:APC family permease n=1 Tax=Thermoplasma sp. Kam2015 TaxID=2094122 RepID=UPI000D8FDC50|nr:APC family permease [Thermoplasma sp. Kam2015]PYB69000.1 amino acid transporter [Thermoplasma sp. Kam2015]
MPSERLKPNQIGLAQAIFQGVSYVAPAADVAILLIITAGFALGSTPLAALFAWAVYFLFLNANYQFSRFTGGASGYYGYVAKSIGPRAGFITAMWYVMFQFFSLAAFGLLGFATFLYYVSPDLTHIAYIWILFVAIVAFFTFYLGYRGLRPSLNYSMFSASIEIGFLVLMGIIIAVKAGSANTIEVFTLKPLDGNFSLLFFAMIFSIPLFAGSGTVITLAEETRGSLKTIKRSIWISMIVLLIALLVPAYALTVGYGVSNMASFSGLSDPGIIIFEKYGGIAAGIILIILTVNSYLSSNVSLMSSVSRVIYSLGRDGVLPKSVTKIHPRYSSPYIAVLMLEVGGIIVAIIPSLAYGPFEGALILFSINIFALLFTHILVNASLPIYVRKNGKKMNPITHILLPVISILIGGIVIYYSAVASIAQGNRS